MEKFQIQVEHKGKIIPAAVVVDNKTLTVSTLTYGCKSARVSSNNEFLAELLLKELINQIELGGQK